MSLLKNFNILEMTYRHDDRSESGNQPSHTDTDIDNMVHCHLGHLSDTRESTKEITQVCIQKSTLESTQESSQESTQKSSRLRV